MQTSSMKSQIVNIPCFVALQPLSTTLLCRCSVELATGDKHMDKNGYVPVKLQTVAMEHTLPTPALGGSKYSTVRLGMPSL
jgi:hypothetical protein